MLQSSFTSVVGSVDSKGPVSQSFGWLGIPSDADDVPESFGTPGRL